VSYVWFAPNHVRAFRRDIYEVIGGYNPELDVLDDQELMCRLYQHGEFFHIKKCLYFQRMHPKNTQRDTRLNARIQNETVQLYDAYVEANLRAWSARNGLLALDLGAAHNKPEGYMGVDQYAGAGVDFVCDVTNGIDLADSGVGVLRAVDFLEHVPDKVALFNELYRLLAHGGMLISMTPSTDGRGAFQDPTHVAYYNENSFWYFTDANYAAFVPPIQCKFQVSRLITFFPSPWHEEHNISYICANLIAIKDGDRQGGLLNW
jgi:SAM-dependent methyltransferase